MQYQPTAHPSIPAHRDDNDVTLNICIGDGAFTGITAVHVFAVAVDVLLMLMLSLPYSIL